MRVAATLWLLAAAPVAAQQTSVEVHADHVEFGAAFPLTVTRTWPVEAAPAAWDDAALAPLVVRADGVERETVDGRVVERRRFDAWVFRAGTFEIPLDDPALVLEVAGALGPDDPQEAELPGGLLSGGSRSVPWWVVAIAALALAGGLAYRGSARRRAIPAASPGAVARARLAALRDAEPGTRAEVRAFHVELTSAVRDLLDATGRTGARASTSAELAARVGDPRLDELLREADLVKFAGAPSRSEQRRRMLELAERIVAEVPGP